MHDAIWILIGVLTLAIGLSVLIRCTVLFLRLSGLSDLIAELHDRRRENRR